MITIVNCTARREPKFDWLADSIVQALNFCDVPTEFICVDKLIWSDAKNRREQLADAIKGRFSYRHVAPKPSPWQGPYRKTKSDYYDLCGARNTGIALARGTHVTLVDDCTVVDELWLQCHARAAKRGICLAGAFRSYTRAEIENGRVVRGELHPMGVDSRGEATKKCSGSWLFGLNCSFPVEAALKVNGYDEKYSGQGGSEDCNYGIRLEKFGCTTVYMGSCLIYQILETHEPVCEFAGWGVPQPRRQKELLLTDGRMHFANEYLIQEWLRKPQVEPYGNDFDLRDLRRNALQHGTFPTERSLTHDWRDNQPLSDME